jgi:uncharacterized protein (TIGR03437 family)
MRKTASSVTAARRTIKMSFIVLSCAAFIGFGFEGSRVSAYSSGPPNSRTGAPGEPTCATVACHNSFAVNSGGGTLSLTGLPASYSPDQEISLTVTLNQASRAMYGFQITAIDGTGRRAGDLTVTDSRRTQKSSEPVNGNQRDYISHTFDGISPNGTNQNSWTFRWKAPLQSAGPVTFYAAGNAANGSGTSEGDFIYTISASIQPATIASMANVSAASFAANGAMSGDSIAAAFSTNMSSSTAVATSLPLPFELAGVQVKVRDAAGDDRNAQLFFVSPGQINYLVPQGASNGVATVMVRRSGDTIAQGTLPIETVAPGLFSANANGQGVAAAVVLRRRGAVDTFEPVAQFNATANRFEPVPIDLGPETDQVFLIVFGTAFRGISNLSSASATIGGTAGEVIFAGAAPGFAGLDQANIRIPRSLAGRGLINVVFTANGKPANSVQVNVR